MLDIGTKFEGAEDFEMCELQVIDNSQFEESDVYECIITSSPEETEIGDTCFICSYEVGDLLNQRPTESFGVRVIDFSTSSPLFQNSEMNTAIILGLVK